MDPFQSKTAIVTGGASGIGRAVGLTLARRGARVVLADLNADLLSRTIEAASRAGIEVRFATLDVTDAQAVSRLVAETAAEHGRLDFMFNNAGITVSGDARDVPAEDWRRVIEVNLMGVVNGALAAYPVMVGQRRGHIVNTASMAGLVPIPGEIPYTASKFGVVGLSHALRIEGADLGVRVSVVCPGLIDTPIIKTSKVVNMDRAKLMALAPKAMPAGRAAQIILRGVERNRATIPVGFMAWWMWIAQRLSPGLLAWIWQVQMRRFRSQVRYKKDSA